ncbi:hypothetical protein ACF3MZ_13595 [Paenibacillaceae bacterium WGS1546]|uniref:hypothetical protein n=1 Tax=Cohnella sp. WGS1546 TaxID=3366810 RepID=UPI00372CEEEE
MFEEANLIFIIAAFALGLILILMRDRIPQPAKRPLAILSIALIAFAFFLIVYSFLRLGT